MKKLGIGIFLVLLMAGGLSFAQGQAQAQNSGFAVEILDNGQEGAFGLNPFPFHMAFMERVVYDLGLNKKMSQADLVQASDSIFQCLKRGGAAKFTVQNFRGGKPVEFVFHIQKLKGNNFMFCISNYDTGEDRILGENEKKDNAWAMGYEIIGKKLVEYKYAMGKVKKPSSNRIDRANYYLQDGNSQDESQVEGLLLAEIGDPKFKNKGFAYVVLTQYYLQVGQIEKAKEALKNIKGPQPSAGISIDDLVLITSLELAATEKSLK